MKTLTIKAYSPKGLVVKGATESQAEVIRAELGESVCAQFNANLGGWVFSRKREDKIKAIVASLQVAGEDNGLDRSILDGMGDENIGYPNDDMPSYKDALDEFNASLCKCHRVREVGSDTCEVCKDDMPGKWEVEETKPDPIGGKWAETEAQTSEDLQKERQRQYEGWDNPEKVWRLPYLESQSAKEQERWNDLLKVAEDRESQNGL